MTPNVGAKLRSAACGLGREVNDKQHRIAAQAVMLCAATPNSRDNLAGARPAIASSTICCLNAAGYGGLVFPISDFCFQ